MYGNVYYYTYIYYVCCGQCGVSGKTVGQCALTWDTMPQHRFYIYALCGCCRHAMKIINHHSKPETI